MSTDSQLQPTVYVVEADRDARQSLVKSLTAQGYSVREFPSFAEFESSYNDDSPGCLILDAQLSDASGVTLYEQFLRDGRRLPVIFVSADADVSTAVAAMKAGAVEFLEKPVDRHALARHVARAVDLDAQWRTQRKQFQQLDERIQILSRADRETLELLLAGVPNKVMASRLGVTERAIELRRQRLMQRLQVSSLAELLDLAVTHRVLSQLGDADRTSTVN